MDGSNLVGSALLGSREFGGGSLSSASLFDFLYRLRACESKEVIMYHDACVYLPGFGIRRPGCMCLLSVCHSEFSAGILVGNMYVVEQLLLCRV